MIPVPTEDCQVSTHIDVATEDIARGLFVAADGSICGAGAMAVGVCHEDIDEGDLIPIAHSGIALVLSGAAVTKGAELVSDAAGKAVTATALSVNTPDGATPVTSTGADPTMVVAGSALPQKIRGFALNTVTDANQWIAIKLY